MSERPTQAEVDGTTCEDEGCPHYGTPHSHPEANSTHAQEVEKQEVLKLAAYCRMSIAPSGNGYWDNVNQLIDFKDCVREKDAANAKHWWKLCGETTGQLADTRMLLAKAELTIAQLKEEIELLNNRLNTDSQDFTIQCLREIKKLLRDQLSATQAREAYIRSEIADFHADRTRAEDVIKNIDCAISTEHTNKWLAEHDANVLEDAANRFRNENCTLLPSTIECAETLETWANELRRTE